MKWIRSSLCICGALALGFIATSAQAWPAAQLRDTLAVDGGEIGGIVVKVHGTHGDCQPSPGGGLGSRHRHVPRRLADRRFTYAEVACDQLYYRDRPLTPYPQQEGGAPTPRGPVNRDVCLRQPSCPPGQRTFCVREARPGCCIAWRRCESILR
jgi:hypothetical protein